MCSHLDVVCRKTDFVVYDGIVRGFNRPLKTSVCLQVEIEIKAEQKYE